MKGFFKRLCAAALTLTVAAAAFAPAALAVQLPVLPKDQCVVDAAGVLSDETTQYLDSLNGQLEGACSGAQIGVVTVDYTGSASTEDYALDVFNTWGIGDAGENNGVLILLVMESPIYADGDYYLTYGDGFRNTTLEKQASALAQTMEDSFVARDYDAAVKTCADAVAGTIAGIYGVSLEGEQFQEHYYAGESVGPVTRVILLLLEAFFIFFIVMAVFRLMIWPVGYYTFGWHWGPFGWFIPRGPRPPRGPRGPRGPRNPPPPPPPGGFGGFGGYGGHSGGFGGGGFSGGGFGGMGGGMSHGGGGGRGR